MVEVVRVFQEVLRQIGLRFGQSRFKVGQRFALSLIQTALNLQRQNIAAPSVGDGFPNVKLTLCRVFDFVQQDAVMKPRNLSSKLLDKFFVRVSCRESPHIKQVCARKAFHFRKLAAQVFREPLDDFRAPAHLLLLLQNLAPRLPVEQDEFAVDRERGAKLRLTDPRLEVLQEFRITCD